MNASLFYPKESGLGIFSLTSYNIFLMIGN
jgi:hypothetical protein